MLTGDNQQVANYVANELRINGYELYYWESNGKAELDFVIQKETL